MRPTVVLSNVPEQCVTFLWNSVLDYYVGYRFFEHEPKILNLPVSGIEGQPTSSLGEIPNLDKNIQPLVDSHKWLKNWLCTYHELNLQAPIQLNFQAYNDGSARCTSLDNHGKITRELYFQPAEDGVWMWMKLTTSERIAGACCIQQCLRYTGNMNASWRRVIAKTPFLSELDMQAMGNPNQSLTYVRRNDGWFRLPVQHVALVTVSDYQSLSDSIEGEIDTGLIVRETVDMQTAPQEFWEQVAPQATWDQIATGMYWERTACVSNRNPADCVHAWIDFGPLEAGESRTLHGKFYFIEGSKDDLLALWQQDFRITG